MSKKKPVKKKKIKKVKKYNLDARIKNALRRVWLWSPMRREVVKRCKVDANTSRCERCRKLCDKVQIDHQICVTPPETGFDNWSDYIARMFIDSTGLTGLCESCHKKKTTAENLIRKKKKDDNKL